MKRSMLMMAVLLLAGCEENQYALGPRGMTSSLNLGAPTSRTNTWTPASFTSFQACAGEAVSISGLLHVQTTIWNDADGVRIRSHLNTNLAGVGLVSGRRYRVQQITNGAHEFEWSSGVSEANQVHHFNVISATSAGNFSLTMNGTWRWDGLGGVTIEPKKWESVCR